MGHNDAYESCKQAVSVEPPAVIYEEVLKMMTGGSQKEAIGALEMFLAIWPDFALAHNDLGALYFEEGEKEKALGHYERVLELEPWNVDVRERLGELGRRTEDRGQRTEGGGRRAEDGNQGNETNVSLDGGLDDSGKYLVSAIVSTYNSERFIRGCLEDLEAQTIAGKVEIIVVNSGSEQNEEAIVKEFQEKYPNVKYIKTDERETVYAAWNRGIKAATAKYITNANTDDRHRKDAFEVMTNILETLPEIALVYADVIITETENEIFEKCTPVGYFNWMNFRRKNLFKGCFTGPQPMWRKNVHEEYGYFDDSFVTSGDYEFWFRISQTRDFLRIPVRLGLYLKSMGSIEHANRNRQKEENLKILEMYRDCHSSGKIIRRIETGSTSPPVIRVQECKESILKAANPDILLSIIIPTAGPQKYIRKCVESIKNHTPEAHEIIFVDNGCKAAMLKWVRQAIKRQSSYSLIKAGKKMVIVNTGSTDRTKVIAKTFGARVYDFEWTDDFSEARNLSLSKATGDCRTRSGVRHGRGKGERPGAY